MNTDSINDPDNELNSNISESLIGFNKFLYDPYMQVIKKI